jgi:hypothetical protein
MTEISEEKRYEARVEIEHNFVKGLIAMNAGAGASMLAFLQAIWGKSCEMAKISLVGVMIFGVGIFFAVLVNFFRYLVNSSRSAGKSRSKSVFLFFSYASRIISLLCFLAGLFYIGLCGLAIIT